VSPICGDVTVARVTARDSHEGTGFCQRQEDVNRLIACTLIVVAGWMHLSNCSWEIRPHDRTLAAGSDGRTMYYHTDRAFEIDIFLFSKTADGREEARTYGLMFPLMIVVGAMLILQIDYFMNRTTSSTAREITSSSWEPE
jgi:hypothetical protein